MDKSPSTSKAHSQVVKRTDKGPDPIHRSLFQLKLLILYLYRGVNGGYSFILGKEIEESKKFDDLIFQFTQNKQKYYRLIHTKHKFDRTRSSISADSLLNEINGDFYLPKYFFSYLDAKKESLFSEGTVKDMVICTNINFNDQIFRSEDIKIQGIKNKDDILEIKIGSLTKPLRYKFEEEIVPILKQRLEYYKSKSKRVLSDYNNDDIKDFLNHLTFAVDCPNEQELDEIIKGEIGKEFDFHNIDIIYSRFMIIMLDWLQGKETGSFITDEEGKQFFEEAKRGIPVLFNIKSPVEPFTGRSKELDILHKLLKEPTDKTKAICISGIGGVGKSELARKYISEFSKEYNNVLWFNAESYQELEECFRSLASGKLGITTMFADGNEKGLMSIIEEVYRAFSNRRCLVIFDNVQQYQSNNKFDEGIDRFLPTFSDISGPYILITSCNKKWPSSIHVLSLDVFEKDEALQFISKVLKTNIDENSALADGMHCYPLALQQAVSCIKVQNMKLQNLGSHFNITHYLDHLKDKGKDVLNFSFHVEYTKIVYVTWIATLNFIRNSKNGTEALKIINILSFMAPDDIPMDLLLNLINDYEVLSSALDILKQYSMVTIHHKLISLEEHVVLISVHRLVQEVIRLNLMEENKNNLVLKEALMLFTKRENVNYKTLKHAISVWNYSCKPGVFSDYKIIYCPLVSIHIIMELLKNHQYTEMYSFGQKAITFCRSLPMYDMEVQEFLAILILYKAVALEVLGKYNNAIETFREGLSISEFLYGNSNPKTLIFKHCLAKFFLKQGNYYEAIKLTTELCKIHPLTHANVPQPQGKDDIALDMLQEVEKYLDQMDSSDSKQLLVQILEDNYEDSLRLYQSLDYNKDRASIKTHNNLNIKYLIAQLHLNQRKYPEALKEYEEVLEIGRKVFGENHPETLHCQYIIAELLRKQCQFNKVLNLFEETYDKQKTILGIDHPDTLDSLFGKAITLEDQGKLKHSLMIYQEVLKKRVTKLGKDHPSSLEACTSIGDIFYKMRDYDKALEKYYVVFNIQKKPINKTDNLAITIKIGMVHFDKSEFNVALLFFNNALKFIKDTYGCDHPDYLPVSTYIAEIYLEHSKYDLALDHYQNILKIQKKKLGEEHADCLFTKYQISKTLPLKNKFNKRLEMHRILLREMDVIHGKENLLSLTVRNKILACLTFQEKYDEAFQEYQAAMEIQKLNPGRNKEITRITNIILVDILTGQNKHDEVLKVLTEMLESQTSDPKKDLLTIAEIKNKIATTLVILNKRQRAIKFFKESFLTFDSFLGSKHPKTVELYHVLQNLSSDEELLFTAVKQNKSTDFIKELVTSGCNFEIQDDEGRTLLHHAINQGSIETTQYLLSIGVDFTKVTEKGNSCLHIAVLKGNKDIVQLLLQHSSSRSKKVIDIQTVLGGMTALHVAAKNNNLGIVKDLLKYGAKYNIFNNDNKRPIDLAEDEEVKSILRLVDVNFKLIGCGGVKINELKSMKEEDLMAVINACNENGKTLLQVAINKMDHVSAGGLSNILQEMKFVGNCYGSHIVEGNHF